MRNEQPLLELELWYEDLLIAKLHDVCPHQGTWFAKCELKIAQGEGILQDSLLDYMAFSEEFDRRIAQGEEHDFSEFERFGSIASASSWNVPLADGSLMPMAGRMWFIAGQACWQHPESHPSAEVAASDLLSHIAHIVNPSGEHITGNQ